MNPTLKKFSVPLLRWTLGLVVLGESLQFAFSASVAHFFRNTGLPPWVRPALGLSEALAALLFLLPFTATLGAYLLLLIFTLAALVHVLHGQLNVGSLLVYAVAVLVCLSGDNQLRRQVPP